MAVDRGSEVEPFLAAFDTLAQAVRRARGARAGVAVSLTLSQYGLLEPLLTQPTGRVRELASRAGITAPTATRILDTLERRGLIHRAQASEDRRGVSVRLTQKGVAILSEQHEWLRNRQRAFHAGLAHDERALAPDLMIRIAELIDELAGGPEE